MISLWGDKSMRTLIILAVFITATQGFCAETGGESRFHLITTKCETEVNDGPETTPQSPPLNVDDPSTPGCNRWEINVVVDGDITHTQRSFEMPLLDINYGIGDNIQLKYELPYMSDVSQGSSVSAVGESKVGIKHMYFEDEQSKLQLATYPQLTFVSSNSDAVSKGLASPGVIVTLPLLMAMKVGKTSRGEVDLTANLGYNISTKDDTADFISASVGLGTPLSQNLSIMGELVTEQAVAVVPDEARAQVVIANVGMMGTISRQFMLFGAIGRSLYASDTQTHTYGLVGFRLLAGGPTNKIERVAAR